MDEGPTNWELGRRLNDISGSLRELIGQREYGEYQRAVEHRLDDITRDAETIRMRIDAEVKALHDRITAEAKTAAERGQWKASILIGLIPALVAVAAILVTIWLHGGGG